MNKDSDGPEDEGIPELEKSEEDLQASIAAERNLVEQWSRFCPQLSHIEFASGRVWRASQISYHNIGTIAV